MLPAAASARGGGGGGGPSLRPRPRSRSRHSRSGTQSSRESPSPSASQSRPPRSRSRGRRSASGSSDRHHHRSSGSRDRRRHHRGASQASSGSRGGVPRPGDSRSRPHNPPRLALTLPAEEAEDSSSESGSSPSSQVFEYEPPPPTEEEEDFACRVRRMANALHLRVRPAEDPVEDPVFGPFEASAPPPAAVPVLPTLARVVQRSWEKPSSVPPTSERLDGLYRMADGGEEWYSRQPAPNSIVVDVTQLRRPSSPRPNPSDREGKKLDLIGQKIYSAASLLFKVANYSACMAAYQRVLQQKLRPLFDSLPENERRLAHLFSQEATQLASHQVSAAKHVADCSGKVASLAVFLRRQAWLRSSTLPPYARALVEDLPFDGQGLFHADTDRKLDHLQKMTVLARRLSLGSRPASGRPSGGSPRFQAAQGSQRQPSP